MAGRQDYEERIQEKKMKYEKLIEKSKARAIEYSNSNINRLKVLPLGQPILVGHHSEKKHRKLIQKAHNDINKAIKEEDKSIYYEEKIKLIEENKAIYNDDPNAIMKLKEKLEQLENERKQIKSVEHASFELSNIGARIREIKKRIGRLEKLEEIEFKDEEFCGGRIIHNKEINRIQFIFEDTPSEYTRNILKKNGFHWSRKEMAWQRLFNENTICITNRLIKEFEKEEKSLEEELEL